MGTTSCNEVKYVNKKRNEIDLLQNDVINSFPLPLLLLSLIKIKEIKKLLNKYQDIIEKDKNLKLLPILNDINKSSKLLKDYANKFEKLLSQDLLNIKGIEIYDFALKQINNVKYYWIYFILMLIYYVRNAKRKLIIFIAYY